MTDLEICYEQPLNERIRLFLRLEHLFKAVVQGMKDTTEWHSRWTIDALLDLLELLGRGDVKGELIKELERVAHGLTALERMPEVDASRLQEILDNMDSLIDRLHAEGTNPAAALAQSEFLANLRRRHNVSGGKCDFDQPAYHYWLQQDPERRLRDTTGWLDSLESIRLGIHLVLRLIRESAGFDLEYAEAGFYQRGLDSSRANQLLRVAVPRATNLYPEISSGKHRFTVRFLEFPDGERPQQTTSRVAFSLSCCCL